ncbi:hypothetical protein Q5427_11365 [Brochothrix thermosphacta]|uniref:hypothetical protein n=1 Tax=Brochothrix thermosphacta TaxID=2756 RepID=UPI0027131349|nr:hypothetical protein [Brochothrix thermosphacta]MDO7864888.1 hypothetical protein [Brochothrix thermosphacta]
MALVKKEMRELFSKIVDSRANDQDQKDLESVVKDIFGDGKTVITSREIEEFNALIIETADSVSKVKIEQMLSILADVKTQAIDDQVMIKIPERFRADFVIAANGASPQLTRVTGQKQKLAQRQTAQIGLTYNPRDLVSDTVTHFNELVADVVEAKVQFFFKEIEKLSKSALINVIPKNNVLTGAGLLIKDFNKTIDTMARLGARPLLIADPLLIGALASQDLQNVSDSDKTQITQNLVVERVGHANAAPLINQFVDLDNSETAFDVQTGYVVSGAGNYKPFQVRTYGPMFQNSASKWENGTVQFQAYFEFSLDLVQSRYFGVIQDTSIKIGG